MTQTISMLIDDGFDTTAPYTLTAVAIAPHGFLVIEAETVRRFEPGTIKLLQPNGQVADTLTYTEIADGTTWSRYPVHGGGWQANTPPTPGDFNLPAPNAPTVTPTEAASSAAPSAAPQASTPPMVAAPDEIPLPRWAWLMLGVLVALVVWFLWASRTVPPPLQ